MTLVTDFSLAQNAWHTFGDLRARARRIVWARQADPALSARIRTPRQSDLPWARDWNQELFPLTLFADHTGLRDADRFRWTPDGAADFEIRTSTSAFNVQCTVAYPEWASGIGKHGGHTRHLELRHTNDYGHAFGGGRVSEPTARDDHENVRAWRAGIHRALVAKLNARSANCRLLICAPLCWFNTLDHDFADVVAPPINAVGHAAWGEAFDTVYVLDQQAFFKVHRPPPPIPRQAPRHSRGPLH